jgi:integrating conjugative element protein (TIGR03758 family)
MSLIYRSQFTVYSLWLRLRFGITGLLMLLVACAALAAGAYADFLTALARRESVGNSHAVNQYGYAGLYQMGEGALIDAGYYRRDGTTKNDWRGGWTGKGGINSLNDFLNSPATQTQAITGYHDVLWDQIKARGLDNKVGQTYNGVPITQSGLIAAAHLIGAAGLRSCLNGGSCTDANNTTALSYMSRFGGFDVASLTGSTPTGGGGPVNPVNNGSPVGATASNTSAPFPTGSAVSTSAAFAAGAGVEMADIRQFILATLSVTLLLWAAWTTRALFSNWRFGKATLMDMEFNLVSSVTLMSVVLFIVLS